MHVFAPVTIYTYAVEHIIIATFNYCSFMHTSRTRSRGAGDLGGASSSRGRH
jgi:hypothetical protein